LVLLLKQDVEVNVNLIITDYCMPGMTGYDLLKKIKVITISFFSLFLGNLLRVIS
jgi:CheY-like chemotaxis protein